MNRDPPQQSEALAQLRALTPLTVTPLHLVLGSDAYRAVNDKLEAFRSELEQWRGIASATDFKN
jgi:hypothetical protein